MLTFLMIIAVLAIVAGAGVAAYLYLQRSQVSRLAGDFKLYAPYLVEQTARVRLRVQPLGREYIGDEDAPAYAEMKKLWSGMTNHRMKLIGTFASDENERVYIIGQHPDSKIVGLVGLQRGMRPFVEFLKLSGSGTVGVLSGAPGARAMRVATLTVEPKPNPSWRAAVEAFASTAEGRALDVNNLIVLFERVHSARMDYQLKAAPTLAEIKAHAAAQGAADTLHGQQLDHALEMNHVAWRESVQAALLDNTRRKLKLTVDTWSRLEPKLIVIHAGMDPDDVLATLAEYPSLDALGVQLKAQELGPLEIFEGLNEQLPTADRRRLVVKLSSPVAAAIYARAGAMQSAGVPPQALAA
ncbi:hypothetical protein [Massilia genomosp. 1]|uniref:Uncharacterized protein n=1 Tax=Massilia genomosp. 1 TaxID=2609280 RepID=A0ABX0MH87_9BURK|nr:hypothetical protein [Massilia genomosp. 1]NHZ62161.1 hypothetical protein [Massilia genomosp. 1]